MRTAASRALVGLALVALTAWLVRSVGLRGPFAPTVASPIFVLLLDATRFDRLVTYDPAIPVGTFIDRFAQDSVIFERAYSTSSWTRTAVASLLSGRFAETHGVLGREDALPTGVATLQSTLQARGYRTHAWSSNPNILPEWGFGRGFDSFTDVGAQSWPRQKADAAEVFAAVRQSMDAAEGEEPVFHYIHLMDSHAPYVPNADDAEAVRSDARLATTFPGGFRRPEVVADYFDYLGEILGMDREIGAFFEYLRSRRLYERSLILVLADHGEEFLDHGTTRHGKTLYEEVMRVPMILKLPGRAGAGARISREVGYADLLPTMLGALGMEVPPGVDGRCRLTKGGALTSGDDMGVTARLRIDGHDKAAVVQDRRKLIVDHLGQDQFFDLRTDPSESVNRIEARPGDVGAMRAILDSRVPARAPRVTVDSEIDPSVRERLRVLGYQ